MPFHGVQAKPLLTSTKKFAHILFISHNLNKYKNLLLGAFGKFFDVIMVF